MTLKKTLSDALAVGHAIAILATVVGFAGFVTTKPLGHDAVTGRASVGAVSAAAAAAPYDAGAFLGTSAPAVDRTLVTTEAGRFLITGVIGPQVGQAVEVRDYLKGERALCAVDSGDCYRLWDDATALEPVKVDQKAALSSGSLRMTFFFLMGFGGLWIMGFWLARDIRAPRQYAD